MPNVVRIYECHCGQLTPVDTPQQPSACAWCQDHKFMQVHWFEPNHERGVPLWMHSRLEAGAKGAGTSSVGPRTAACVTSQRVEDNEQNKLDIERARAVLMYFEMLKRVDAISYQDYDIETQRVLRRVIHEMQVRHSRQENHYATQAQK